MEDICYPYLTGQGCPNEGSVCPHVHHFQQLSNIDKWVIFNAPHIEMLDFLAYKYLSHHYFKFYLLSSGPLVRFASAEDACAVVSEYRDYYNPQLLSNCEILVSAADVCPDVPAETEQHAKETGPVSACIPIKRRILTAMGSEDSLDFCGSDEFISSGCGSPEADPNAPQHCMMPRSCQYSVEEELHEALVVSPNECGNEDAYGCWIPVQDYIGPDGSPFDAQYQYGTACYPTEHDRANTMQQSPCERPGRSGAHHSWTASCTEMVLDILRQHAANPPCILHSCGWQALHQIWGVHQDSLDNAVLNCLAAKLPHQQEQILLSFAAIDLASVKNLSAYLNCLIREHETTNQVCLHFLAGLCAFPDCCYVHPVNTAGWNALYEFWNITYKDLDYAVLNYLSKKSIQQQDEILLSLANSDVGNVLNLSAYLSRQIQKYENTEVWSRPPHIAQHSSKKHRHGKRSQFDSSAPNTHGFYTPNPAWVTHPSSRAPFRKQSFKHN